MTDPTRPFVNTTSDDPAELGRVVQKLNKINLALMQRVERSMDQQANAFTLFQTAINLESQVRVRTEELNHALRNLELANVELSTARDAAERANHFKTRFFTALGHDLLQPLHAARLSLSELMETEHEPSQQYLGMSIGRALTSIEDMLTTLLDISRLEAGAYVPNFQRVPLNDLFENLAIGLEPVARKKGLDLRWRPTKIAVHSDPLMLRRMTQNLLSNAAHYTSKGGMLLTARRKSGRVAIEVWDTGPGISVSEQERIFDEFQRGAASEKSGGLGFGLGLTIVRRMSDALGHTLELKSRDGGGSRFSIICSETMTPNANEIPARPILAETGVSLAKPVLVIDNDLSVLEAMQSLLSRWGADVRLARDLDDVTEIIVDENFKPAIVLADYHLDRGKFGIEAVHRVRSALSPNIPAILITADRTDQIRAAAMEAWCEILHKPVRPAELRALMQHMMK